MLAKRTGPPNFTRTGLTALATFSALNSPHVSPVESRPGKTKAPMLRFPSPPNGHTLLCSPPLRVKPIRTLLLIITLGHAPRKKLTVLRIPSGSFRPLELKPEQDNTVTIGLRVKNPMVLRARWVTLTNILVDGRWPTNALVTKNAFPPYARTPKVLKRPQSGWTLTTRLVTPAILEQWSHIFAMKVLVLLAVITTTLKVPWLITPL